ncbi:HTTM domain-containing protein [Natronomonas salina]|uniref:HTTM domain-containing protein n=1 Tax=Natronomonas salina TaxID=1710540 RepID=UPI001BA4431B|nr:HTTM domain-containing protein [Natronomonas salina]
MSPPPPRDAGRGDSLRERGRDAVDRRLGVDARALAAFRISLGLLVVADLLFRARELTTFYTDAGVLPRAAHAEFFPTLARLSIHGLTGSTAGQAVLFLVAGCAATALAAGYRTRLATAVVAVLHASMHARNTYLMNGGDALLVLALFLAVFLPLDRRWSIDALRRREASAATGPRVASMATATVLLQPVVVYLANAAFKLRSDAWTGGTAVRTVLELEQFSVLLGPHLTAFPGLLMAITWLWVAMLVASPLLLVATGRRRTLVVAAFAVAHLGMLATMRLGLFPLVVGALLLLYLPPSVWDRIERGPVARWNVSGTLHRTLDGLSPATSPVRLPPEVRRLGRITATAILAVVLVVSVLWPAAAVGVVDTTQYESVPDPDGYTWKLFAPEPPSHTRWFVAPATLESGGEVDALDGSAVEWGPPADAAETYPGTLWHRYLAEVRWASHGERVYLAEHLCRRAEGSTDAEVTAVTLYVVEQPVPSAGGGEPERTELVSHDCRAQA